jgi:hypothetical protein
MGLLFTWAIQRSIMKRRKTSAIPDVSSDHDVADERQRQERGVFPRDSSRAPQRLVAIPARSISNAALRRDWLHTLKTIFFRILASGDACEE